LRKLILLLMMLLFILACNNQDSNVDMQIAIPVSIEEVKYKPIEEFVTATGTVYAIQDVDLKAETPGFYRLGINKVTGKPFALGDHVNKGEIIIFLDNPELENNIKIESQKLNLDISEREFEKQKSLYEKGGVTLRELKNAEIGFIDAQYNYKNAIIQLAKTKVIAPFEGIIIDLPYHTEGTRVITDSRMVQIMNYRKLYSEFNLPGKDLPRLNVNQRVRVMNYSVPDDTLWGKVTQVAPAFDPDSRSFKATIDVENLKMIFRPGMFVKAEIIVAHEDSAIVIPKDILLAKGDEKWVYTVVRGSAARRRVTTGIENPLEVQVVEGLKVDERLVVKGFEILRNNSKVKIIR